MITLNSPAQQIPEQAAFLQKQADKLARTKPDSAFLLLAEAETLSPKNKLKAVRTTGNWLRAKTMYLQKNYDSTLYYADLAIALGNEVEDYTTLSSVHNLLGVLAKRQGKFKESLVQYDQSLAFAKAANDSITWAKALQNIGNVHRQLGQADSTLFYYEASISIKELLNDPLSTAKTTLNLGNYYYAVGDFRKPLNFTNEHSPTISKPNTQRE